MAKPFVFLLQLLALLFMAMSLNAQSPSTFTVIKVSDKVYSGVLKRELKTGDVISPSDKLSFGSKESYLYVISPNDGQKSVRNVPDSSPRELMQLFEKFLDRNKKNLKARGDNTRYMESLAQRLSKETLLILGSGRINIDTTQLNLKKPSGIKAVYELNAKKIEKMISDESGFKLGRDQLFENADAFPFPKIRLYYYEDLTDPFFKPFLPLGSFVPYYADETALGREVRAIVNAFPVDPSKRSVVIREIMDYLTGEYADPIEENVKDWLMNQKLLK